VTKQTLTTGGSIPLPIIRQGSLFGIQDLFDLEPTRRFEAVFSTLELASVVSAVSKQSWLGAPTELNYGLLKYIQIL
jgi:transposase